MGLSDIGGGGSAFGAKEPQPVSGARPIGDRAVGRLLSDPVLVTSGAAPRLVFRLVDEAGNCAHVRCDGRLAAAAAEFVVGVNVAVEGEWYCTRVVDLDASEFDVWELVASNVTRCLEPAI